MGLFDFLKKEKPEMWSEMMDEDQFWSIIEASKNEMDDLEEQAEKLTKMLEKMPYQDIIGFKLREEKLRFDSYNSEMWCAGYVINGGCSDDMFEYFRCWIISYGKEVFYSALKNPDSLVNLYAGSEIYYDFEDFMYVADNAFENKTKKEISDYIDYEVFVWHEGTYPNFDFNWEEDDEESMSKICPQLMKVAWN